MASNVFDIFEADVVEKDFIDEISKEYHYQLHPPNLPVRERTYIKIYLRASSVYKSYKREGYDILTYLADLGGLFEISVTIGSLISGLFVSRMFLANLIKSAYKIQKSVDVKNIHLNKPNTISAFFNKQDIERSIA